MPSSRVMTVTGDDSLPEAAMVRMVPTGRAEEGKALPSKKSQKSPLYGTPSAMALAESMTLPPPTARIKSTSSLRHSSIPSCTSPLLGFGRTPPRETAVMPALSSEAVTR